MSEDTKKTTETKIECNHIGMHAPVATNVLSNGVKTMLIVTHNCLNCGHIFITMEKIDLGNDSGIVTPQVDFKGKIK